MSEQLEEAPSTGWVVHEVVRPTETDAVVWAWCRVQIDGPGYTEVHFTEADGHTVTAGPGMLQLGRVLFQVWC
jgi:hypothetical protein